MPYKDPAVAKIKRREANMRLRERRRLMRHAAQRKRIADRLSPPIEDRIWAAGHFEGEGTVTLTKGGKHANCRPIVCLTSTDFEVTNFFNQRWPGQIKNLHPRSAKGNARAARMWALGSNEKVECFLRDVLPHVRTERVRTKIELALEDIADRVLYQRGDDVRERSRVRRERMKALNQRGANTVPPGASVTFGEAVREDMRLAHEKRELTPLLPYLGGGE